MTSAISYMSVGDAIRANEDIFFTVIESAVSAWVDTSSDSAIKEALFDYRVSEVDQLKRAA